MPNKKITEEGFENVLKTLRFGYIGLFVLVLSASFDFVNKLTISGISVLMMALSLLFILLLIYKGKTKGTIGATVLTMNPLIVLVAFAEGLQTGTHLFILPLLFALGFLMSNSRIVFAEVAIYFFITVISFCVCIIFCKQVSTWQNVSVELANQMFTFNSIMVVFLCAAFAYTGIHFEKEYRRELIEAKNKAEMQEEKIKGQNKHLQDIAFMNAHVLRSPLTNILALTQLIDADKVNDEHNKEMIQHLQKSAQQMDAAIKEIVIMATTKNPDASA